MSDFIPVLSAGPHSGPEKGACVMEMVSFMHGGEWTDYPECTEMGIARLAQMINDYLSDADRHLILQHFDRLFGTALDTKEDMAKWQLAIYKNLRIPQTSPADSSRRLLSMAFYNWVDKGRTEIISTPEGTTIVIKPSLAQEAVDILGRALDLFDETFGRETVEKKDLSELKALFVNA